MRLRIKEKDFSVFWTADLYRIQLKSEAKVSAVLFWNPLLFGIFFSQFCIRHQAHQCKKFYPRQCEFTDISLIRFYYFTYRYYRDIHRYSIFLVYVFVLVVCAAIWAISNQHTEMLYMIGQHIHFFPVRLVFRSGINFLLQ